MFELTQAEYSQVLRSHFVTLEASSETGESLRSQIVTSKRGGTRYMPFAFTGQGVAMLASVLNSPAAISVNIAIVRAFVTLRRYALGYQELAKKIAELEKRYDGQFSDGYQALKLLLHDRQQQGDLEKRNRIGFKK